MRRLTLLALVLIAAAPATAQAPASPVPPPAVEQTPATEGVAPEYEAAPAAAAGLPARAAPPRTLRAYWHLFGAFAVTWVLLFGYALTIGRRMARLEGELRRLNG